jgi:hypothetical protein
MRSSEISGLPPSLETTVPLGFNFFFESCETQGIVRRKGIIDMYVEIEKNFVSKQIYFQQLFLRE